MTGQVSLTGRERLLAALNHREPDRVPYDLGSTQVTGIHEVAYRAVRECLGLPPAQPLICDEVQGLILPDRDLLDAVGVDTRGLFPLNSHNDDVRGRARRVAKSAGSDGEEVEAFVDEWGITQHRPYPGGLYFTAVKHPLEGPVTVDDVKRYPWPDTGDARRIAGLRELAEGYRAEGRAVVIKGVLAGIFEMAQRVRGMAPLMMDMASDEALAAALLDKMVELKLQFWEMTLPQLRDIVDVVSEADDYGTQVSQLISPRMFRRLMKPRLATLFARIHELAPEAKLFFHSCGNVRPLLPDFIEIGVDILNPVHVRATGMEPLGLKRDFGNEIVFWGGGVDTQDVLPHGTPEEVKDDVRRNIEALAPGGGFVFNTVHNIQADVPPQNVLAMWEALREYGVYA
jgi:uroporphyrinogen decarboxylase